MMKHMLKLFYIPRMRASRVRWMLEELAEPYELARIDWAYARGEEYRRTVHPLGAVPALRDGETTIIESAAIIAYLADKFPEKRLAPPLGERGPSECRAGFADAARPVDGALRAHGFILGERFSAADVVLGSVLNWSATVGLLADLPSAHSSVERLRARPAFQAARRD